jgi:hypothetical protein
LNALLINLFILSFHFNYVVKCIEERFVSEIALSPLYGTTLLTYLLTYSRTPRSRFLLQKLTSAQLVKKFPAFYGIRSFITAFTSAPPPASITSQLDLVHTPTYHFVKIHVNIN